MKRIDKSGLIFMSTAKKRRGRPKGSGINDTARLQDIAARIGAQPNLKPTTAIKAMGITDPSSIRRLRDKYKKFTTAQRSLKKATPGPRSLDSINRSTGHEMGATAALAIAKDPTRFQDSTPTVDEPVRNETSSPSGYQQSSRSAMETPPPLDNEWVASWCSSNLVAMADVMNAQVTVTRSLLSVPYIAMAVRQQLALNAFALSILPPDFHRRTLH